MSLSSIILIVVACALFILIVLGMRFAMSDKSPKGSSSDSEIDEVTPKTITITNSNINVYYYGPPAEDDGFVKDPDPMLENHEPLGLAEPEGEGTSIADDSWEKLRPILTRIEEAGIRFLLDNDYLTVDEVLDIVVSIKVKKSEESESYVLSEPSAKAEGPQVKDSKKHSATEMIKDIADKLKKPSSEKA